MENISNKYKFYNIFRQPIPQKGENFHTLLRHEHVRIVAIAGSDEIEEHLYIQDEDEWVMLIEGEAKMEMDGEIICLNPGDTLFIPARTPHRVLETKKGTRWLAVHINPS
jgi:cupin 2 domain-containing protein